MLHRFSARNPIQSGACKGRHAVELQIGRFGRGGTGAPGTKAEMSFGFMQRKRGTHGPIADLSRAEVAPEQRWNASRGFGVRPASSDLSCCQAAPLPDLTAIDAVFLLAVRPETKNMHTIEAGIFFGMNDLTGKPESGNPTGARRGEKPPEPWRNIVKSLGETGEGGA